MGSRSHRPRSRLLSVLTALTFVLAVLATVMVFAQDRIFDASSFATTIGSTTSEPAVNEYLADAMTDALIDQVPDLAIVGPVVDRVSAEVLRSDLASQVLEGATQAAHVAILSGREDSLVMDLSQLVVPVDDALSSLNPDFADVISDDVAELSVRVSAGEIAPGAVRLAEGLRSLTFVLVGLTVVGLLALVALESTVFRGLSRMGSVLGLVGLLLIVVRAVGSTVIGSYGRTETEADALAGVWNIVLGDLRSWGWVLILFGALLAGLGTAVAYHGRVADEVRERWQALIADDAPVAVRVGRTVVAFLAGVWALTHPTTAVATAVRALGFVALVFVVARLARAVGLADRLAALEADEAQVMQPASIGKRLAVPVLAIIGLGIGGVMLLSANDDASALGHPEACNGHIELCDRRFDEVTLATSHNAMSSTASDFYLPNHLSSMRAQLNHGVRGFMIDTVYGRRLSDGTIRTSIEAPDFSTLGEQAESLFEAVRRDQPDGADDEDGREVEAGYLCHSACEIGSIDATEELTLVRKWLDDHPREVVVFVVQDGTRPVDTAALFDDAGFADMIHTQAIGEPFPTLGEMVDSGQRVFIMVEENGEGVPWLHETLDFTQETPFSFASVDDFSCEENRGGPDAPLFIVNHFITLARPSNQTINDAEILGERVEQCAAERGQQPNLIAVDFIGEGDVMQVVDSINGVD